MDWQPIETAPKDGTRILIYCDDGIEIASWRESYRMQDMPDHWLISQENDYEFCNYAVHAKDRRYRSDRIALHWMPLPQPPSLSHEEE